ncbi:MAG: DUF1501 domain-containing protein, partial [Dehalococcoidales bacterium]|nr:DUF1501 domain-containing protein [Dehalococcoidales bacterium]
MNRRDFLKTGAAFIGAGVFIPPVFHKALLVLEQQSLRGGPADDGRILVLVQMAGGNDGLNTVVPFTDTLYYDARPGLSVPQNDALPLDSKTGLHPVMGKFKELWDKGVVAIVEGVGYPNQNFSHFVSMDIWQTADPNLKLADGWLGRYYEKHKSESQAPFLGLAIGGTLPTSFRTQAVAIPSVQNIASYQFQKDALGSSIAAARVQALLSLYLERSSEIGYGPLFYETILAAGSSTTLLQDANVSYQPSLQYPSDALATAFRIVAATIAADVGVKIFHVAIGGFDTHANQLEDHP